MQRPCAARRTSVPGKEASAQLFVSSRSLTADVRVSSMSTGQARRTRTFTRQQCGTIRLGEEEQVEDELRAISVIL
jgi:hypothetical protein